MSPVSISDTVRDILTARVYDVAIESPLEKADSLSNSVGCTVYLKREDLQPVHSFKLRGAYNKISQLSAEEQAKGVITASAGNHAQGVALAAQKLGISALIVMPRTTPEIKIRAVRGYGAEIVLKGDNYTEAAQHSLELADDTGRTYVHPFDDPLVIAGQGTIGKEILEQLPVVTHVFVPVGGGGLLAGVAQYLKALSPNVVIIGVEPKDSAAMTKSLKKGERITLPHVGIFADGVAVKQVGINTFATAQQLVDNCITVTTDQICSAIKDTFEATRSIVEPSGALALAGLKQYDLPKNAHAVAICSGANVGFERLQQIAERTLIGSGREALLAVEMPEQPGALHRFCTKAIDNRSITEFSYRLQSRAKAQVLVGLAVTDESDKSQLIANIRSENFHCEDLSADDTAKEHVRHMVGGQGDRKNSEQFYLVDFPERSGALADFLAAISNKWNISLFHYRSTASDIGSVLIGFEAGNAAAVEKALKKTGYTYLNKGNDAALKTFVK
jgi:threonine dehydratase